MLDGASPETFTVAAAVSAADDGVIDANVVPSVAAGAAVATAKNLLAIVVAASVVAVASN